MLKTFSYVEKSTYISHSILKFIRFCLLEAIYFSHFKFVLPVRSTLTMRLLPKHHLPNYVLAIANILDLICIFLTGLFSTWPA